MQQSWLNHEPWCPVKCIKLYISFIGIHKLLLSVTRGYGDHPPLTSDAALEEEMRSQLEHAIGILVFFDY